MLQPFVQPRSLLFHWKEQTFGLDLRLAEKTNYAVFK